MNNAEKFKQIFGLRATELWSMRAGDFLAWLDRTAESAQLDNQINLCDSCDYSYPDCPAKNDDVIFGNGIGNDNICTCNKYKPSAQPEYEPVTAEDFAKVMSESTIYNFITWYWEALKLTEGLGFVICKKM